MLIVIIGVTVVLMILGFEMFLVLGLPALAVKETFYSRMPDVAFIQKLVGGIDHSTLLAIPFFLFAAQLMASGQITRRLMGLISAFLGHTRGGIGYTTIGASMAFGSVSGSAPATVAAIGGMVYPELRKSGYREKFSLGLIVSSAETALLIPPSITLIVYGWMTGTSVAKLFAGGLAIGIVLALTFIVLVAIHARRQKVSRTKRFSLRERINALIAALWALGMTAIILGGIYSGLFTPTEAAVVSVVYAIFVECVVYRELGLRQLVEICEASAVSTAVIFVLLAFGGVLSFFITLAQVPATISSFLHGIHAGPVLFLLILNVCFLIAGMFIDPNSALLILLPPLFPVANSLGIDPVHLGMIVTLNISLGMITPPFGLDLFVASAMLQKPVSSIAAGVWPFVLANLIALAIVTYLPQVSLFIPHLLFG